MLGYAFAAKGSHLPNINSLEHEHKVYEHLWRRASHVGSKSVVSSNGFPLVTVASGQSGEAHLELQVPISFGVVKPAEDFNDIMYPFWPIKGQVDNAYACNTFLLLSYHGLSLSCRRSRGIVQQRLSVTALERVDRLHNWAKKALFQAGIIHPDIELHIMLWCRQLEAIMMIDFEGVRPV